MSIRNRLYLTVLLPVVIAFLVLGIGLFLSSSQMNNAIQQGAIFDSVANGTFTLSLLTNDYLLNTGERVLEQWDIQYASLASLLSEAEKDNRADQVLIDKIVRSHVEIKLLFVELVEHLNKKEGSGGSNSNQDNIEKFLIAQIVSKAQTMVEISSRIQDLNRANIEEIQSRNNNILLVISSSIVIPMIITMVWTANLLIKNIGILHTGIQKISAGNFDHVVEIKSQDELGALATAFNEMVIARKQGEEQLRSYSYELERTNLELEHSNEDLNQFAYVASHDLQEPLRMVASYLQLIERRYKGKLDKDADEFIRFAVDGATRMKALIKDLLSYSRLGTQGKEFEPNDFSVIMENSLSNLKMAIKDNNAKVTYEALPIVDSDNVQIGQLFQNLIGNAIKFRGDTPPTIHIKVEEKNGEWLFSVKDNGIGIAPEFSERIFVIFQRLDSKGLYPGTGIGLAICKKIVERHGGRIWMESESGKGAIFFFTLPQRKEN